MKNGSDMTSAYCWNPAKTVSVRPKVPPVRSVLCRLCQKA